MRDSFHTDVFGVEKEAGRVSGIIAAVYQSVLGQEAYPSVEEKTANNKIDTKRLNYVTIILLHKKAINCYEM